MQGFWNLIGKSGEGPGKDFQYDVGEKASSTFDSKSIWTLHHGKRRLNGNIVSVFICDAKVSSPEEFQLAKTSHKRVKTLRHPNIIKYLDGFESESLVYVVTEAVIPLAAFLDEEDGRNANLVAWGLYQVINGLSFLINDGNLLHENVNIFSIFVGLDGEWKLGGVEYMHTSDTTASGKLPCLCRYDPPEGKENKRKEKWSSDAWGLGCLVWEIYNGTLEKAGDLKVVNKIPKSLMLPYCDLVHANPKKRTNPKDFLQRCLQPGQFFDSDFLKANLFLNEIQIKDINEQKEFFISLDKSLDTFPKQFCVYKVLPQLLNAFEFGAAGSAVLSPLFKVGLLLDEAAYQTKIVPCIIKLFSSNDRATRIQLLQQMEKFVKHLQPAVVDNQIFACVATGFGDTLPAMREQTVKAMLLLAPKLSPKTMNNQLLRYFSKLQMDEQPGIRTNTTICLGKIAEFIPAETRQKMLAPGFVRALHDPFPHARNAGVMAMSATNKYYSPTDIATKILPALCTVAIDQEKSVRDNAFKVIKQFISILEKHSTDPENAAADLSKEGEQGSTWTGWAVSSFTSRFYQNTGAAAQGKSEGTTETQKPTTTEGSTLPVSNGVESQKEESGAMSDHSNYDDAFGEEYWENKQKSGDASGGDDSDNSFSSMKKDLFAVKKALEEVTTKVAVLDTTSDHDSDSDYGDWGGGGGGDSWGKEDNDDWGSRDAPTSKTANKPKTKSSPSINNQGARADDWGSFDLPKTKSSKRKAKTKTSTLSAEDGWGKDDNDDWGSFDDPKTKHTTNKPEASRSSDQTKPGGFATQPFSDTPTKDKKLASSLFESDSQSEFDSFATAVKEKSNLSAEKSDVPVQNDPPSVASASPDDGWGADEWDKDGKGWDDEQKKKEEAKERRKQELQRKREEKKQQRELANKDKKAKNSGAMKLGAVKKNPMGDG